MNLYLDTKPCSYCGGMRSSDDSIPCYICGMPGVGMNFGRLGQTSTGRSWLFWAGLIAIGSAAYVYRKDIMGLFGSKTRKNSSFFCYSCHSNKADEESTCEKCDNPTCAECGVCPDCSGKKKKRKSRKVSSKNPDQIPVVESKSEECVLCEKPLEEDEVAVCAGCTKN